VAGVENSLSGNGQTVRPGETIPTEMNTNSCPASSIRREEMHQKTGCSFRVSGISAEVLNEFRQLSDDELQQRNVFRYIADQKPGYPCRVSLVDAEIGESLLLLNFGHLMSSTPYRSIGPIFVRESARETYVRVDEIPEVLRARGRLLSMRAYDSNDMLTGAAVIGTAEIDQSIQELFADRQVAYLHVHYAGPGCFACRVDRA
jgi:hypothetical protein